MSIQNIQLTMSVTNAIAAACALPDRNNRDLLLRGELLKELTKTLAHINNPLVTYTGRIPPEKIDD